MRCIFLMFSFFPLVVFSQQVKLGGRCTDKKGTALENVQINCTSCLTPAVFSEKDGTFSFFVAKNDTVVLVFTVGELIERRTYITEDKNYLRVADIKFPFQQEEVVQVKTEKTDPFELPKLARIDLQKLTLPSVERFIALTTAATSNNELTTNYTVRGGNYDENLVYVNGFLVYRPFLTRSGQQEGMSFVNTALVESVSFSAGGFDAKYGDKLSSVLDIEYKTPTRFRASGMASLLGVEAHVEQNPTARFNYVVGARYRSNGYLLNSLPTKGSYNPVFWDAQFLANYAITENVTWSVLTHFSSNDYQFSPQTSNTDFGTANEAYSFRIYFDGQEKTRFQTKMGGTSLKWKVNKKLKLDVYATIFSTDEREYYDIQGQYFINELETDPSKEEFGDSIAVLGIGTFLNHARNRLNATIASVYHNGEFMLKSGFTSPKKDKHQNHVLQWGLNFQQEYFKDVLSEWRMIDSAGYSQPQIPGENLQLFETIKGKLNLEAKRVTSFIQLNSIWSKTKYDLPVSAKETYREGDVRKVRIHRDTVKESNSRLALTLGARAGYTSVNQEFFITPRAALVYIPRTYMYHRGNVVRRNRSMRLATGLYYQPPFYREFRTFDGQLNLQVKSQKSFHIVAGSDMYFSMWERESPFKFSAEVYYKYLWDVNPYEIDNVRTRYFAENNAVAYAYGLDLNVHGEFVKGIESFFKIGFLSTKEDILNDFYKEYYNAAGEKIIFGYSQDQTVVDSATFYPGYIPRPTDQLMNFGALVQDQMPGFESFSVQMGMQFGTRLPYGPPDQNRYKDTLRMKSYFRVDVGMSYDLLYDKKKAWKFLRTNFSAASVSFEVFNLLGINNVLSKQWIQDVEGRYYSIPNFLTQRRFNLKVILRF